MNYKTMTPEDMERLWDEFKADCDNAVVVRTEFSQKDSDFVTREIPSPISYTILGFCLDKLKMSRQNFYETYKKDPKFDKVIARMTDECEKDARRKFENGSINTRLAGLWMSHYGYSTQIREDINADNSVNVTIDYGDKDESEDTSE